MVYTSNRDPAEPKSLYHGRDKLSHPRVVLSYVLPYSPLIPSGCLSDLGVISAKFTISRVSTVVV